MSHYIGFLKESKKHAVIFKSTVRPTRSEFNYFIRVMGPYPSWDMAKLGLKEFKGYRENPIVNPITRADIKEAAQLTKRLYRLYKSVRKKNPGKAYHDAEFEKYLKQMSSHVVGTTAYSVALAKAFEHLKSSRLSRE